MVKLLLAHKPDIKVTEAVVEAANSNWKSGTDIILLLVRNRELHITEGAKMAVAFKLFRGRQWWCRRSNRAPVVEVLQSLLANDTSGKVGEGILRASLKGGGIDQEEKVMLRVRDPAIGITAEYLLAVANISYDGGKMMEGLLTRDQNHGTEYQLLLAAVESGCTMMVKGLLARDPTIAITEELFLAAAERSNSEVLAILLARDPAIQVTEELLLPLAKDGWVNASMQQILLTADQNLWETQRLVFATVKGGNCAVLEVLLARSPAIRITGELLLAAVEGWNERLPRALRVAGLKTPTEGILGILLARNPTIRITEKLLLVAVQGRNSNALKILFASDPTILITEGLALAAVECWGNEVISICLARNRNVQITARVLVAILQRRWSRGVMEILVPRVASTEITETVLIQAILASGNFLSVTSALLSRNQNLGITEALVAATLGSDSHPGEHMGLLLSRDSNIRTTEAAMLVAAGNKKQGARLMEVLLSRDPVIGVSERVWKVAIENKTCGKELITLLLARDLDVEIGEEGWFSLEMVVARIFGREAVTIVIPGAMNKKAAVMVAKYSYGGEGLTPIDLFRGSDIKITETVVAAAANNWNASKAGLKKLLDRDPNIEITAEALVKARDNEELLEMLLTRSV